MFVELLSTKALQGGLQRGWEQAKNSWAPAAAVLGPREEHTVGGLVAFHSRLGQSEEAAGGHDQTKAHRNFEGLVKSP